MIDSHKLPRLAWRTIKPIDYETIIKSVKKTHRAIILDFGYEFCGISAEIVSFLMENAFSELKSPAARMGLPDVPTPTSCVLEKIFYPNAEKIAARIKKVLCTK